MCLHCNYKEYRQEAEKVVPSAATSASASAASTPTVLKSPLHNHQAGGAAEVDANDPHAMLCPEERALQAHMTQQHQIDFAQILAQHQQLAASHTGGASGDGVVLVESPPMNDMYLQVSLKSLKYIDDELLRKDEFKADLFYSCPVCLGDCAVHAAATPGPLASAFAQHESVTFDYLMAHFWHFHQFKVDTLQAESTVGSVRLVFTNNLTIPLRAVY